jgi:hypothetical protein
MRSYLIGVIASAARQSHYKSTILNNKNNNLPTPNRQLKIGTSFYRLSSIIHLPSSVFPSSVVRPLSSVFRPLSSAVGDPPPNRQLAAYLARRFTPGCIRLSCGMCRMLSHRGLLLSHRGEVRFVPSTPRPVRASICYEFSR